MRKVPKKSYLWVKWWWQVLRLECWSLFLRFWVGAPLPPHCHWWNVCQFNSKKSYQVSAGHVAQMELLRPSQICLGSFNRVEVPQSSKLVDIGEEAPSGQMGEISSHSLPSCAIHFFQEVTDEANLCSPPFSRNNLKFQQVSSSQDCSLLVEPDSLRLNSNQHI